MATNVTPPEPTGAPVIAETTVAVKRIKPPGAASSVEDDITMEVGALATSTVSESRLGMNRPSGWE